jgi:hypothetical protein
MAPQPPNPNKPKGGKLAPKYGVGLTPEFVQSPIGSAERNALNELYAQQTGGGDLSAQSDVAGALRSVGLIRAPNIGDIRLSYPTYGKRAPVYASAADAVDAKRKKKSGGGFFDSLGNVAGAIGGAIADIPDAIGDLPNPIAANVGVSFTPAQRKQMEAQGSRFFGGNLGGFFELYTTPGKTVRDEASFGQDPTRAFTVGKVGVKAKELQDTYDGLVSQQKTPADAEKMRAFLNTAKEHQSSSDIEAVQNQVALGPLGKRSRFMLLKLANKNGWAIAEPRKYSDADLARRAFTLSTNAVSETIANAARQEGQLASLPAGLLAVGTQLYDAARTGDLQKVADLGEQFVQPYTYYWNDVKRKGFVPATSAFIRERPVDAALLASGLAGIAGRGAGAAVRTGTGTGESLVQRAVVNRVISPPAEGTRRAALAEAARVDRPVNVEQRALPGEVPLVTRVGTTTPNLFGSLVRDAAASLVSRGLRSDSSLFRSAAQRSVSKQYNKSLGNIATSSDAAGMAATAELRKFAGQLSFHQRERLIAELMRSQTRADGTPVSLADIAKVYAERALATEDKAQAVKFSEYSKRYQQLADVPLEQSVIDAARAAATPLITRTDMLASMMIDAIDAIHGMGDKTGRGLSRVTKMTTPGRRGSEITYGDLRPNDVLDISVPVVGKDTPPVPAIIESIVPNPDGSLTIKRTNIFDQQDVATIVVQPSDVAVKVAAGVVKDKYVRDFKTFVEDFDAVARAYRNRQQGLSDAGVALENAPKRALLALDRKRLGKEKLLIYAVRKMNEARAAGSLSGVRKYARMYRVHVQGLTKILRQQEKAALAIGENELAVQLRNARIGIAQTSRKYGDRITDADANAMLQNRVLQQVRSGIVTPAALRNVQQPAAVSLLESAARVDEQVAALRRLEQDLVAQRAAAPSASQANAAAKRLVEVNAQIRSLVEESQAARGAPSGFVSVLDNVEARFDAVRKADQFIGDSKAAVSFADKSKVALPNVLRVLGDLRNKTDQGLPLSAADVKALVTAESNLVKLEGVLARLKSYEPNVPVANAGKKTAALAIDTNAPRALLAAAEKRGEYAAGLGRTVAGRAAAPLATGAKIGRSVTGVVQDMRNRFWNQIDSTFRERYSDKRPGWVSVEYVRAGDLRGMEGNAVGDAKVRALRGQEYENPIILDYDPDTGYGYVSEGNHRLAAATDDQFVPVQVIRSKLVDIENLSPERRADMANVPMRKLTDRGVLVDQSNYVPTYIYPHEIGFSVSESIVGVGKPSLRPIPTGPVSIVTVRKLRREAERASRTMTREAIRIMERGRPVLSSPQVNAAIDAAGNRIAVTLELKKRVVFPIDRARGESKAEFIARGEMLMYVPTGQKVSGRVARQAATAKNIDVLEGARLPEGRLMPNTGVVFTAGDEDLGALFRRSVGAAGAIVGSNNWTQQMRGFLDTSFYHRRIGTDEFNTITQTANDWVVFSADRRLKISNEIQQGTAELESLPNASLADLFSRVLGDEKDINAIRDGGDYYIIPRYLYDEMTAKLADISYRPTGGLAVADKITRVWRTFTLNIIPRTGTANLGGSAILAALAGCGPRAFYAAYRELRYDLGTAPKYLQQGYGAQFTNEASFAAIRSRLPASSVKVPGLKGGLSLDSPFAALAWWMNTMRRFNGISEDFGRLAVYYSKAIPAAERASNTSFWTSGRILSNEAQKYLEMLADEVPNNPRIAEQAAAFTDLAFEWLGDLHAGGKANTILRIGIPFHQWYRHIIRLTFVTMPLKYPGRALFLQRLGEIGNEYLIAHGVYPGWMMDVLPIMMEEKMVNNVPQQYILAWHTGSLNPFSTTAQIASGTDTQPVEWVAGMMNPMIKGMFEIAFSAIQGGGGTAQQVSGSHLLRDVKNQDGNPIGAYTGDGLRYYLNTVQQMVPLSSLAVTTAGQTAEGNLLWNQSDKFLRGAEGAMPLKFRPQNAVGEVPGRDVLQLVTDFSSNNALAMTARALFGGSPTWVIGHGPVEKSQFAAQINNLISDYKKQMRNTMKTQNLISMEQEGDKPPAPVIEMQVPTVSGSNE